MDGKTVSDTVCKRAIMPYLILKSKKIIFRPIFPTAKSISNLFRYKEEDHLFTSFHNK